jgi:hypothetical protein
LRSACWQLKEPGRVDAFAGGDDLAIAVSMTTIVHIGQHRRTLRPRGGPAHAGKRERVAVASATSAPTSRLGGAACSSLPAAPPGTGSA